MKPYKFKKWIGVWRSENKLDGKREHPLFEDGQLPYFYSRKKAREFIEQHYGYIRTRIDLRAEPHGWKMPVARRVTITVE